MAHRLVFQSGQERFALAARDVREVVTIGRMTRVPHAPQALLGLSNIRGTVMPIVSIDALLDKPSSAGRRVIVLDRRDPIGLAVADVPRLVERADGARMIDIGTLLDANFASVGSLAAAPAIAGIAGGHLQKKEAHERETVALLAFFVASQLFALPLEQVEELISLPAQVTVLPGADQVALGSIAHRGGLLPLLSLRALLKLAAPGAALKPRIVIARIKGARVGLIVDALDAILRVSEDDIDPLPLVLSRGSAEAKIQAIVRRNDGQSLLSLLATDHLLNEALMSRLQEDRVEDLAAQQASGVIEQILVFRLGEEEYGLPVASVREVVAMPDQLTRLPRAPAFVAGIMNLRGRVIPVIDQRLRFDVPGMAQTRRRIIVAALGTLEAGFVVDAVSEVLRVPTNQMVLAPEMGEETRVFDRIAAADGGRRMILVIEPQQLLDRAERDLLAAMRDEEANATS